MWRNIIIIGLIGDIMNKINNKDNKDNKDKNMSKTKVLVLAEDAQTSPSKLIRFINSLDYDIKVKETCFGGYIEGEWGIVEEVAEKVRNLEKNKIFCRDRGFPIWDKRRCRAYRNGGAREGFHQLEAEQKNLTLISKALDELEKEENRELNTDEINKEYNNIIKRDKKIKVELFKEIIEEELSSN